MDVSLPDSVVERIDELVRDGSYGSRTELIVEAIRLLTDRDTGRERASEAVRTKVAEGLDAVDAGDVHPGDRVFDQLLG